MVRFAGNNRVTEVDVEIERPVDRGRKRDVTRTNSATQPISGSGGSGTVKTNTSTSNWWIDHVTASALGATPGAVVVEIQITNTDGSVITSVTGDVHDYPMDLGGHVMKPGWSLDYVVSQDDSNSYDVDIHPIIRKPEPGSSGGSGDSDDTGTSTRIDSFEDGGLTEYSGDTGDFSVVSTDSVHLDNSLGTSSTSPVEIHSGSLENLPERGDTFSWWAKTSDLSMDTARIGVFFGRQDASNNYHVRMNYNDAKLYLNENSSTGANVSDFSGSVSGLANDQWDKYRVEWSGSSITAKVFPGGGSEGGSVSAPLSNFAHDAASGGFGWFGSVTDGTEHVRADSAQIE